MIIGFGAYHAMSLMNAIPNTGFMMQVVMIGLFVYIVYWSMIGIVVSITLIIWAFMWLYRLPGYRARRRARREQERLRAE